MKFIMKSMPCDIEKSSWLRKSLFIMRCILLFLLLGTMEIAASVAYSQSVKLSLNLENTSVQEVLSIIEQKSAFYFTYNVNQINTQRKVSIAVKNKTVTEILNQLFEKEGIKYQINDKHIVLYKVDDTGKLFVANQHKGITISGVVRDSNGDPIIGANVLEKSSTINGTITNVDGQFTLTVPENAKLVISYIGYNTQEVSVAGKTVIDVMLTEDSKALDEVVVVGYGTQKKVNLTGSVASISSDDIKDRVQTDVLSSIQGTVPGVTIISRPGKDVSINFRGRGNLGTSEPLYVIDGAIADATFFSNLDPNSIENISFLKDAASSAIYGSRAAYGVVLVTTKQGKDGRMEVSYSGMVGMKAPTYTQDLVNSWEYAELYNESLYNTNPSDGKNQGIHE